VAGVTDTGTTPVPVKFTVRVPASVMAVTVPVRLPVAEGVNVVLTVHEELAGKGLGQAFVCA